MQPIIGQRVKIKENFYGVPEGTEGTITGIGKGSMYYEIEIPSGSHLFYRDTEFEVISGSSSPVCDPLTHDNPNASDAPDGSSDPGQNILNIMNL